MIMGVEAVPLRREFGEDTPDLEWLPEIAQRGWVVVTADHGIYKRQPEREALGKGNITAVFLPKGLLRMQAWDQVVWVLRHWRAIDETVSRAERGTIFRVTQGGKPETYEVRTR